MPALIRSSIWWPSASQFLTATMTSHTAEAPGAKLVAVASHDGGAAGLPHFASLQELLEKGPPIDAVAAFRSRLTTLGTALRGAIGRSADEATRAHLRAALHRVNEILTGGRASGEVSR